MRDWLSERIAKIKFCGFCFWDSGSLVNPEQWAGTPNPPVATWVLVSQVCVSVPWENFMFSVSRMRWCHKGWVWYRIERNIPLSLAIAIRLISPWSCSNNHGEFNEGSWAFKAHIIRDQESGGRKRFVIS